MKSSWFAPIPLPIIKAKPIPEPTGKRKEFCYRLEIDGHGIYNAYGTGRPHPSSQNWELAPSKAAHPPPDADPMLRDGWLDLDDRYEYYFGFSSMEQFRRWFFDPEWLQQAHEAGVRICIYQTDDFLVGDTQMVFRKSTATLIGKADLI